MSASKNTFSSPFVSSNPTYRLSVSQNFSSEEIKFEPVVEALELLYRNISFGNFFFLVIDWRTFTYPYISPNSLEVIGYSPEEMTNLEWLMTVIYPRHTAAVNQYGEQVLRYLTTIDAEKKRKTFFNHCLKIFHPGKKEFIWIYQQHPISYVDENGAMVYSITVATDVTHLQGEDKGPSWSVTERLEDGTYQYLFGSELGERSKSSQFTSRELDILNLSARGFNNKEIAKRLSIGTETITTHKKKITKKTNSKNMAEAIAFALNAGYL